jgi:N-acetylmuramoyl-L-alanine amidase
MNREALYLYKESMWRFHCTLALALFLFGAGYSKADLSDGKTADLRPRKINGLSYVDSRSLAKFLEGSESIDYISKSGKTEFSGISFEYSLYSAFIKSGDDVYNIYMPVIFDDGGFLFPMKYLAPVLNKISSLEFSWSDPKLVVSKSRFNVTGMDAVQKMNGLLVEIYIKENLKYDAIRTDDNWLVVTVNGGKVDSLAFQKHLPVKAVYGVKTYQFGNSCQVSLRLRPRGFSFISKTKEDPLRIQFLVRGEGFSDSTGLSDELAKDAFSNNTIDVIVVDPGHGGEDFGAMGPSGTKEKDIVLKIARHLNRLLKEDGRFKPIMTRQDDVFVPLSQRTALANSVGGDLFISIHANAAANKKASGIIAFFLADAKNDEARATASLENSSIRFENLQDQEHYHTDLDFTLRDMVQSEFLRESADLAEVVHRMMSKTTGLRTRGVDQAGFFVLDKAYMPAILLETGFISNKDDEKRLRSDDFQRETAQAIFDAIVAFKEKYEGQTRTSQ